MSFINRDELAARMPKEKGWDTYDGQPTSPWAIDVAANVQFLATQGGGIEIHIPCAGGRRVEVEIDSNGKMACLCVEDG